MERLGLNDSTQTLANRLAAYVSAYKHYVKIYSKAGLLDVAIFGEALARDIAEIVFGYTDLVNLNLVTSFPAVDLGSAAEALAIQVTVSGNTTKIVETQETFFANGLDATYSRLNFIILGEKQATYDSQRIIRARGAFTFDPARDIYDLDDLFNILVSEANPAKFAAFADRLLRELGSSLRPYLAGADRPGQHLRRLFEAHDVTTTNAVKALEPFGVTRAIYSSSTSLSDIAGKDMTQFVADQFRVSREWLDGTDDHIYSGGAGTEDCSGWRRSLRGAYDVVKHASVDGERLLLIMPIGPSLSELDTLDDTVDRNADAYRHFFLVARKPNDFSVDSFRMVLSEPLTYRSCRDGIFLLFLAAELHEIETGERTYIDVYDVPRADILRCMAGEIFLVDMCRSRPISGNHKDFIYSGVGAALKATTEMPPRAFSLLQANLTEFTSSHPSPLPAHITSA